MRILGIDLGSKSIKAVELDAAFSRYEIHDYHEHPVEPGESPALALSRLMLALAKQPDRIAVALPSNRITFRNLQLPTRDRKAIVAGIGFELEDELPFPIERAVYDYTVLAQGKAGTTVHVAATLDTTLGAAMETWTAAGIDPDLVTTESWAYSGYFNRVISRAEQAEPILLLKIGHERTLLYVHHQGTPVLAREIPWGGRDLSEAIGAKYNLNYEQAEQAKLDTGFVIPPGQNWDVTPEQVEFSETLMESLKHLITEVRQASLSCKNLTGKSVARLFAAGGTTLLPGLVRVLEENLRVPVRPIQSLSAIAPSGVTYSEQTDAVFLLAVSAALCLVGSDRSSTVNFRKGTFAKAGRSREFNMASLRRPLLAAGAVAACLLLSLVVQYNSYQTRLKDIDSQLERSLKGFFPNVSTSAVRTYLASPTTLRAQINKELSKQRELAKLGAPNPRSPLDFLKSVSAAVPRDIVTDMIYFQAGAAPTQGYNPQADQAVTLSFYVANPQVAERLSGVLSGKVAGLKKEKTEEVDAPEGGGKQWKITFTGKPTEDSYVK